MRKNLFLILLCVCIYAVNINAQVYSYHSQQRTSAEASNDWAWTNWVQDFRYQFKISHDKDAIFIYCNDVLFKQYEIIDYIKTSISNAPATRYTCKDDKGLQIIVDLVVFSENINIGNGLTTKGERYEIYLREDKSVVCFKCF